MISTVQISPEVYQNVLHDKIIEASNEVQRLIETQQYAPLLETYNRILHNIVLLTNPEQRNYLLFSLIQNEQSVFQPLTQLPRPEQDKWIEWLGKVQQFVLNLGKDSSLAIAQNLAQVAEAYQTLGRTNLAAIAMQQASQAAQQIPEAANRANEFMQIARIWLQFQNKSQTKHALIQALSAVGKLPTDYPDAQWNYLFSIALLYVELGEPQRALKLSEQISNDYYLNAVRQEVVRDAVKRGDLHLAQSVTHKIQGAEYQAYALVEMAVYWAIHHQVRRGNRLFAEALKRVAKNELAEAIQSTLIQTYQKSGQLTIALNAAQRLTQDEPKALALGMILVAYAKANQSQQVQQILEQLIGLIQSETAVNSVGYVNNILQAAVDAQAYNLAMTILNVVQNNTDFISKPAWYYQIVQAPLRQQHLDAALELAQQIPGEFFPEERNSLLQEIAIAYSSANQWHRAHEVLTQIDNSIFISNPYHVLTRAELAAIAPTPEEFTSLITAAITFTQAIEPLAQKALALAAIAQAYLRFGDEQQTQFYLQQVLQAVQHVDDDTRGNLLYSITEYLIKQRQYTAALTIAQANPVAHLQQSSYDTIFQQAVASYGFYVALQMVELESLPDRQAPKLIAIAKTYAQLQRHEDAIELLNRAFEVAQKIADPESRILYINEYIQVPDESDRAHQYTHLVKLYFALGQQDKAQQVVEKTQGTSLRDYLQAWIHQR
ncbi:hypothetical protein H6G41_22330 [Tolypothrix sp. FACHB-123]|uniref:hypothetical protein n=1 Tax=Tolypothrix sp. FACHB-123 TaxID=2692868 RepID=UPI001687B5D3|nr:hypothetical protein [Tolypothrix sp. FACHB-123]MBD2357323.1 hypothetical protein [Tolypothrix sp. FACHB-123]